MRSVIAIVVAVGLSFATSCDPRPAPGPAPTRAKDPSPAAPVSKLADLSSSLAAARQAFNARKGQVRFLTLLSPT